MGSELDGVVKELFALAGVDPAASRGPAEMVPSLFGDRVLRTSRERSASVRRSRGRRQLLLAPDLKGAPLERALSIAFADWWIDARGLDFDRELLASAILVPSPQLAIICGPCGLSIEEAAKFFSTTPEIIEWRIRDVCSPDRSGVFFAMKETG